MNGSSLTEVKTGRPSSRWKYVGTSPTQDLQRSHESRKTLETELSSSETTSGKWDTEQSGYKHSF